MTKEKVFLETESMKYLALRNGDIYSFNKKKNKKHKLKLSVSITGKWDKQGYLQFGTRTNGTYKSFRVHRVIASLFVEHDSNNKYLEVNHIDGNKHNNHFKNLEWVTRRENTIHAHKLKLINKPDLRREKNPFFGKTKYHISLIRSGLYLMENGKS